MTGLIDVHGFKLWIQECVWPSFTLLVSCASLQSLWCAGMRISQISTSPISTLQLTYLSIYPSVFNTDSRMLFRSKFHSVELLVNLLLITEWICNILLPNGQSQNNQHRQFYNVLCEHQINQSPDDHEASEVLIQLTLCEMARHFEFTLYSVVSETLPTHPVLVVCKTSRIHSVWWSVRCQASALWSLVSN